jgi:hypothetical protein
MGTIRINGNTKGRNTNIDTSKLPLEWDASKGSKAGGVFLIIFALFWGGVPTVILISSIVDGTFKPEILFTLLFTVIGAGIFIGGLASFFYKKKILLSENRINISIKSIFGDKNFDEHLSHYKGIRNYSEYHSGGKNSPSYTLYINELIHSDNKKLNIKLDVQRNSESGIRVLWESHCKDLNVNALSGEAGNEMVRKVEDLDKNVKTLIEEGKIEAKFNPRDKPPRGFKLTVEDGRLKVIMKDTPAIYIGMFVMLVFACVFAYFIVFKEGFNRGLIFPLIIISIFILVPIWVSIYHAFTHGCVYLTSTEVINCRIKLNGQMCGKNPKRMNYSDIETASVERDSNNNTGLGLMLKSDHKSLHIAKGQKRESLEWLKNCILSSIAR